MRPNTVHTLVQDVADAHLQVATGSTTTLEKDCVALLLGARTQNMFVTFDNSVPSASNGIVIVAGAQPMYVPLGYHAEGNHNIRAVEAAATGLLDIVQLA